MQKILSLMMLLAIGVTLFSGCATYYPAGALYTEVSSPVSVASGELSYTKVGTAMAQSILGLIATGDASIQAAANAGGIKKVKYVEYSVKNILGIIGEYTTTVYGD